MKTWTPVCTVGGHGHTVSVCRRRGSRSLYLRWWGSGRYVHRSLRHADLERAKAAARSVAADLLQAEEAERDGTTTLPLLLARYLAERTPHKGKGQRRTDQTRADRWQRFLGDELEIRRSQLDRYVERRMAGTLQEEFGPVGPRSVQADLGFLHAVFEWGIGEGLVEQNPIKRYKGAPPVVNQRQPVASRERFLRTLRANRNPRFRVYLHLVWCYGWRTSAIAELRRDDFDFRPRPKAPYGRILKREETDKVGVERWVPLSRHARIAVDWLLERYPMVGSAPLFPARNGRSWTRHYVNQHHRRLQRRAGYVDGARIDEDCVLGLHAYRRSWVTYRKHLPRKDVADAGAWMDPASVDRYTKADEATTYAVVSSRGGRAVPHAVTETDTQTDTAGQTAEGATRRKA